MNQNYDWAVNESKLQRAISMAAGGDETKVKECYVKLGGKVVEEVKPKKTVNAYNPVVTAPKVAVPPAKK